MTDQDTAILINNLHRSFADYGGGLFFGILATIALSWAAIVRGPLSGLLSLFCCTILGIALTSWAHSVSLAEGHKVIETCAKIAGVAVAGMIALAIVGRAPATAMLAIFAILAGGGSMVALWLFAPHENLILLVAIVGIIALLAFMGIIALAIDRRHAREVQNPRIVNYYGPQDAPELPREDRRDQLTGSKQASRLPVVREKTGRWLT